MTSAVYSSLGTVTLGKSQPFDSVAANHVGPLPGKNTLNRRQGLSRTPLQIETPTTGSTVTVDANVAFCMIEPAGALAALTVNMPSPPTPGQVIQITIAENITALTHSGNGSTLIGGFGSSIIKETTGTWFYRSDDTTWYPVGTSEADVVCVPGSSGTANTLVKFNGTDCQVVDSTITQDGVAVNLNNSAGVRSELRYYDTGASNYVGFRAPALTGNTMWDLPTTDGTANQALITNGSAALSWATMPTSHLNDMFICVRPGETVQIDVLHADNNQLNIDATTVALATGKTPLHAASTPTVNGVTGVITYVADTRYFGTDWFMFEANETGSGVTVQQRAVVHIDICLNKPDPATGNGAHFIYGETGGDEIRQYSGSSATTSVLTTTASSATANGLATNHGDSLIYWAEQNDSIIRAWSYVEDVQFNVADMNTDAVFADAIALHPDGGDLTPDVGGTYHDGVLYLCGGSGATDGYFRIVVAKYVPGSSAQVVLDAQYIVFSDGLTRLMGDIQYDHQNGQLLVLSNVDAAATATGTISIVEPTSGVVHSRVPLAAPFDLTDPTLKQLTYGLNGEILVADEDDVAGESILRRLNCQTGSGTTYGAPNDIENGVVVIDMAEYINQPCAASNITTYPNLP